MEKQDVLSLGLSGIKIVNIQKTHSSLEILIENNTPVGICPNCGVVSDKVNDTRYHYVIDRPVFHQTIRIIAKKRRFKCLNEDCDTKTFTEVIDGLKPNSFYTDLFQEFSYRFTSGMTYTDTRRHLEHAYGCKVGLTTIYTWSQKRLKAETPPQIPQKARFIGLDEFSKGKGHDYGIVLTNLEKRRIIDLGDGGKTKKAAKELLYKTVELEGVAACAIDMWRPFKAAALECLPNALVIVDKFHVVKKANEALDNVRKRIQRQTDNKDFKEQLRKYKELPRMSREHLSEKQEKRLWDILELSHELKQIYEFKELLRDIYDKDDQETAHNQLDNWIREALETLIPELIELAHTLKNWREEILNYWRFRITNAITEGKVNKIKTIKRKAYNYNNFESLRLKVLEAERLV